MICTCIILLSESVCLDAFRPLLASIVGADSHSGLCGLELRTYYKNLPLVQNVELIGLF